MHPGALGCPCQGPGALFPLHLPCIHLEQLGDGKNSCDAMGSAWSTLSPREQELSELHVLQLGHIGVGKETGSEAELSSAIRVSWRAPCESRGVAEGGKSLPGILQNPSRTGSCPFLSKGNPGMRAQAPKCQQGMGTDPPPHLLQPAGAGVSHLWRYCSLSMLSQREGARSRGCLALWAWRNLGHQELFGTTLGVKGPLQGHQNHSRTTCNQNGTNWGHSGITRAMLGPAMTTLQPPMVKLGQPQGHLGLPWGREQPHWDHPWLNWNQLGPHWCDQGYRGTDSSQTGTTRGQTGTTWGLRWGQRRPNWGHPSSV